MIKRRNLSGIYIFDKFEGEEKKIPTCLEDCNEETRNEWLGSLEKEALINTIKHLCSVLRGMGDQFGIIADGE